MKIIPINLKKLIIMVVEIQHIMLKESDQNNSYYQNIENIEDIEDIDWLKILDQNYLIYAIQSHLFEVGVETLESYNK